MFFETKQNLTFSLELFYYKYNNVIYTIKCSGKKTYLVPLNFIINHGQTNESTYIIQNFEYKAQNFKKQIDK